MNSLRARLYRLERHTGAHRREMFVWIAPLADGSEGDPRLFSGKHGAGLTREEIGQRWPGDEIMHLFISGVAGREDDLPTEGEDANLC